MSANPTKIFLSYTRKGAIAPALQQILDAVAAEVAALNWVLEDPMTRYAADTIDKKVIEGLRGSDAVVAEATISAPNVMLEIGVARGLGLPIIPIINKGQMVNPGAEIKAYLDVIGHSSKAPLPSDLGGHEYIPYSSDVTKPSDREALQKRIREALQGLGKKALGAIPTRLRRKSGAIHRHIGALASGFEESDSPITRFLLGWLHTVEAGMGEWARGPVFLDPTCYRACLAMMRDWAEGTWAIADLATSEARNLEPFWMKGEDAAALSVGERIFLSDRLALASESGLSQIIGALRGIAKKSNVRVGRLAPGAVERMMPLWPGMVGQHMLLMAPDLVGGYAEHRGEIRLRLERDRDLYAQALSRYESVRESTILLDPAWDVGNTQKEWVQAAGLGSVSKAAWARGVSDRGWPYAELYDENIRHWIVDYDRLVHACKEAVQREIVKNLPAGSGLRCLEIGFGTGAVSIPLLQWIATLNAPFQAVGPRLAPVQGVWGVDLSDEMLAIMRKRVADLGGALNPGALVGYACGRAPHGVPTSIASNAPYDVIFGSLVLHDLVGVNAVDGVNQVLQWACGFLSTRGSLVFADIFAADTEVEWRGQIDYWREWMIQHGLTPAQADEFLEGNQDMTRAIGLKQLSAIADAAGFSMLPVFRPGRDSRCPFSVVVLRRRPPNEVVEVRDQNLWSVIG